MQLSEMQGTGRVNVNVAESPKKLGICGMCCALLWVQGKPQVGSKKWKPWNI